MDEKKKKWEKPALVSIDEAFSYGVCTFGSTYYGCDQGPEPGWGCYAGTGGRAVTGCVVGPVPQEFPCNGGGTPPSSAAAGKKFH